jgi:heavy metal sensor kinase
MKTQPTLRARLTLSVVAVLALVLGVFSLVLYGAFGHALWMALDARLDTEVRALGEMAEEKPGGVLRFEREGISALPEFGEHLPPAYFQVQRADGTVLARSRSLGAVDLGGPDGRLTLPDGRAGRRLARVMPARWAAAGSPPTSLRLVTVVVARGTETEDAALAHLRRLLWALGAVALAVAAAAAAFTVSRGLRPAEALAATLDRIDARHLGQRLLVPRLPRELEPAVTKLNELLARLDESFARERRFTADVSHELRTPLAGLRSLLEVAAMRERSASEYRAVIDEAMDIVRQMHTLAEDLLMLARLDANQIELVNERIPLHAFVDETWRPFAGRARQRRLSFANNVDGGVTLISDREKLRLVLRNLLSNAAAYTASGGRIEVRADDGCVLEVYDSGPAIPEEVMPRLFERFFRADSARSGGGVHCGIGLAVVQAVCVPLGLEVAVANLSDGGVRFRLTRDPAQKIRSTTGELAAAS